MATVAPRLLLIDDDQTLTDLLAQYLGRNGCSVVTAHSAEAAIRMLQSDSHFDLAVMDIMMPGMTGLELLPVIRSSWHIPVIMLTTTDDIREVDRCYNLGCNVYITKPVDYEQFSEAIRKIGLFLSVVTIPQGE